MKFRVLVGTHVESDPEGKKGADGRVLDRVYNNRSGVFESSSDLRRLNAPGMSPKFELVVPGGYYTPGEAGYQPQDTDRRPGEGLAEFAVRMGELAKKEAAATPATVGTQAPTGIGQMSEADLRSLAESEEIDLKGIKPGDRAAVLKKIEAAFKK